VKFIDWLHTLE